MSVIFDIKSSSGIYKVQICEVFEVASGQLENSFAVVDSNVARLWPDCIQANAFSILAVEENKTLETSADLIEKMRAWGMQRNSHFYAFGGGIIQDLSTVTASLYMRGVKWTYYPTTLLGMVDSCIGGKSSINVGKYKNIAGNFYPPQEIIINVEFCKTLALAEQVAGLFEAVKICFADRGDSFSKYIKSFNGQPLPLTNDKLLKLVELSLLTKKKFIEEDEFDLGPRLLLNFGHTFGHAIEAATQFSITHGVAVGLGMLAEIRVGMLLTKRQAMSERTRLLDLYIRDLLKRIPDVVSNIKNLDIALALNAFKSDKKHLDSNYVMVTDNKEGFLERVTMPLDLNVDKLILDTFEWLKKDF